MMMAIVLSALALQSTVPPATTRQPDVAPDGIGQDWQSAWARGELTMRTPGAAEAFERAFSEARGAELRRTLPSGEITIYPFAAFSALGAFEEPQEVWSLYSYRTLDSRSVITVRRLDVIEGSIAWASSPDCRGLVASVANLEDVPLPAIDVPLQGDHETDEIGPTVKDGMSYTLWVRRPAFSGDGDVQHLSVSYSSCTPFDTWFDALRETASQCWSPEPPSHR
jgi:hypothetical protein